MLLVSLDRPLSHSVISSSLLTISCLQCKSISLEREYIFPKLLLIRVEKFSGGNYKLLDRNLIIGDVHYQLYSVVESTGYHALACCFYPEKQKWYNCNDDNIEEFKITNDFFITKKHVLGAIYVRMSNTNSISTKELFQVAFDNDINWKVKISHIKDEPKLHHIWPLVSKQHDINHEVTYSRQAYLTNKTLTKEFKIETYHVLILGLNHTTFEVVKNLVSMGFLNITILLCKNDNPNDLKNCCLWANKQISNNNVENYYILKNFIKSKINENTRLKLLRDSISVKSLQLYSVDCLLVTQQYIGNLKELNNIARKASVKFIAADSLGLFLSVFVDYGNSEFYYLNRTGNPAKDEIQIFINKTVSQSIIDDNIEITCNTWNFEGTDVSNSLAKITNIDWNNEIVSIINCDLITKTITIQTNKILGNKIMNYILNNNSKLHLTTIPKEQSTKFNSLEDEFDNPSFNSAHDLLQLVKSRYAFSQYKQIRTCSSFSIPNKIDYDEIKKQLYSILQGKEFVIPDVVKEKFLSDLIGYAARIKYTMVGNTPIINTILGGILAHCILVGGSHSFPPISQWIAHSFSNFVDIDNIIKERYKSKTPNNQLFPSNIMNEVYNLNILQVGCGATGCETTKLLCEIGAGKNKDIILADSDIFSPSNRNRQFLCYKSDIYKPKATVVANAMVYFYPKQKITSHLTQLSDADSSIFDLECIENMDVLIGTVDNIKARRYCTELIHLTNNSTYFIECGTSALIYSCSFSFPSSNLYSSKTTSKTQFNCNPTTFSYLDTHTILYAVNLFSEWFDTFISGVQSALCNTNTESHETIKRYLTAFNTFKRDKSAIFKLYKYLFNIQFNDKLASIVNNEQIQKLKYCNIPKPISLDITIPSHKKSYELFYDIFLDSITNNSINVVKFDKDNTKHLDFIAELARIRCDCFNIKERDFNKWRVQRIAGHSIPSIISSTAIAAGVNCLNLYAIASIKAGYKQSIPINVSGELTAYNFNMHYSKEVNPSFKPNSIPIYPKMTLGEFKTAIIKYFDNIWESHERDFSQVACRVMYKTGNNQATLKSQPILDKKILVSSKYIPLWVRIYRFTATDGPEELLAKFVLLDSNPNKSPKKNSPQIRTREIHSPLVNEDQDKKEKEEKDEKLEKKGEETTKEINQNNTIQTKKDEDASEDFAMSQSQFNKLQTEFSQAESQNIITVRHKKYKHIESDEYGEYEEYDEYDDVYFCNVI